MTTLTSVRPAVPLHRLDVPAPSILPFAVGSFDTIGPMSRADFPHRHTFHEIVYVTGGTGTHVVDLVPRPLRPRTCSSSHRDRCTSGTGRVN